MNKLRIQLLFLSGLLFSTTTNGQVINGYAQVSGISGTTLNLSNVDEAGDTFEDGEYIVIMQMQDSVIGNVSNTVNFGDLGSIRSAGLYEVRLISSHTESAGTPTSLTLSNSLSNTYNTGANRLVQVITFPTFGSPDYTTVSDMSAKVWDGTTGGVLCFNVDGILTLAHNLSADASGFLGGGNDINTSCGGSVCEDNVYISTFTSRAPKGEGIYRNTTAAYEAARGKVLNGGGGGSCHNGAGGGGGNYTAGGEGGIGWGCQSVSPRSAGGLGGIALSAEISASRIFMGGGGGAGERNNNHNTSGGQGGGIILLNADEIRTTGACGGRTISANGETTPDIGNDGAGGGGAGGSIVVQVSSWSIAAGCPITVSANGGDGGSSLSGGVHGGGGGGGQGVVIFSIAAPSTNTTIETNNGTGGCGNTSSPCNSQASPGSGASGSGVIGGSTGPLPIVLLEFQAEIYQETQVLLSWSTASEINNDYFTILRSVDGINWENLKRINGAGNSRKINYYSFVDESPNRGTSYYQLQQTDFNGEFTLFPIQAVNLIQYGNKPRLYPNPVQNELKVEMDWTTTTQLTLQNSAGISFPVDFTQNESVLVLNTASLSPGLYILNLVNASNAYRLKFIKE